MARNEYENRTDRRVKKREEGEERSEPSYDVVKNRQQPQVFFILVHSLWSIDQRFPVCTNSSLVLVPFLVLDSAGPRLRGRRRGRFGQEVI